MADDNDRPLIITRENQDYQRDLTKKQLTEQEIKDREPMFWKHAAEVASKQISVPIPGTNHYT